MDAKSKANFINSVAAGTTVLCPNCGTANKDNAKHCVSCGAKISESERSQIDSPSFEQIKGQETPKKTFQYVEPNTIFAEGLPEWSIEPPQVMVRRR